jgi:hypothetical protein
MEANSTGGTMVGTQLILVLGFSISGIVSARTIVDIDFRTSAGDGWTPAGEARLVPGAGAVLVDRTEWTAGTVSFRDLVPLENLRLTLRFRLETGSHGFGDGLAVGILAMPAPGFLGSGGGLFGLGNLTASTSSLVIEFDTMANDPDDFGPLGAALLHAGVAYAGTGPITGTTHLPTLFAEDLTDFRLDPDAIDLRADIFFHGNRLIVCCAHGDGAPVRVLECAIPDFIPFEGYVALGGSNGALGGFAAVHSITVETETLPPPLLDMRRTAEGVELRWEAANGTYESFAVLRDGEELARLGTDDRLFIDSPLPPGRYVYELRAWGPGGAETPPTGGIVFGGSPFLVFDAVSAGSRPSPHAQEWLDRLAAHDRMAVRATSLEGLALEDFGPVLWIQGSRSFQRALTPIEEANLVRYVTMAEGARLYLEGADLWSSIEGGALARADGIHVVHDGWPASELFGREGESVVYYGRTQTLDELAPAPGELEADAAVLWSRTVQAPGGDEGPPPASIGLLLRTPHDRAVVVASAPELFRFAEPAVRENIVDACLAALETPFRIPLFRRGDASDDGAVNIADAVAILSYLFARGPTPACLDAADANDDGQMQISDAVALLTYLFGHGSMPLPGAEVCGRDTAIDRLPYCESTACK